MRAAPELPDGYRLIAHQTIDSTNDEAKRLAADGAKGGTVVWAASQTAGRGRRDRDWRSPAGNLYCSVLLRPAVGAGVAAQISVLAALAVAGAIGSFAGALGLTMKWPNDVLLNERKLAGILLESSMAGDDILDWIVLGVGVNLVNHPNSGLRYPATDLAAEGAGHVEPGRLLSAFVSELDDRYTRWIADGFEPVRSEWVARAHGLGSTVRVELERDQLEGRFVGLSERGELVIETAAGGRRLIAAGDVGFVLEA